jgi:hypothetical protein
MAGIGHCDEHETDQSSGEEGVDIFLELFCHYRLLGYRPSQRNGAHARKKLCMPCPPVVLSPGSFAE